MERIEQKGEINFIALGSNLGNRLQNIRDAVAQIEEKIGEIVRKAPIYSSEAQGYHSENSYLNTVISCSSSFQPEEIMEKLLQIEYEMGRRRTQLDYEDRPIDLDFILHKSLNFHIATTLLKLPHPRFIEREFVLFPLMQIVSLSLREEIEKELKDKSIEAKRGLLTYFGNCY